MHCIFDLEVTVARFVAIGSLLDILMLIRNKRMAS